MLRPLLIVQALAVCACEDPPPEPSSSSASAPTAPSVAPPPAPPPATEVPAARVIGDERCPPGQFFVHGGCHTGDSVGIAGPADR